MTLRKITDSERIKMQEAIDSSKNTIYDREYQIEYSQLMVDKGLMANYNRLLKAHSDNIKKYQAEIDYEQKLIDTYTKLLEAGELEDGDFNEEEDTELNEEETE